MASAASFQDRIRIRTDVLYLAFMLPQVNLPVKKPRLCNNIQKSHNFTKSAFLNVWGCDKLNLYFMMRRASHTPAGAQPSAVSNSLIEAAKGNDLGPSCYLVWLLHNVPELSQMDEAWAGSVLLVNAPQELQNSKTIMEMLTAISLPAH